MNPLGPVIRPGTAADLAALLALEQELPSAPHWTAEQYVACLRPEPQRILLVAETDGWVCGFAVALVVAGEAELESIAVSARCQRRGVGRALLGHLAESLRLQGISVLRLEVRTSNESAQSLYRRAGFAVTGRRESYYSHPVEDAVEMELKLSKNT